MVISNARMIFPITNSFIWVVAIIYFLVCIKDEVAGCMSLLVGIQIIALNLYLMKTKVLAVEKKILISNAIASIVMIITFIAASFVNVAFATVLVFFQIWIGTFFILYMSKPPYLKVNSVRGYPHNLRTGAGFPLTGNVNGSQDDILLSKSGHGYGAEMDAANPSYGINPANGMAMLATGFDVMGNVYGTNSADDFMHNRGFNSYSDISGFGLSDHHSVDISSSRDWPTHDVSTDIHSHNHGMNDY